MGCTKSVAIENVDKKPDSFNKEQIPIALSTHAKPTQVQPIITTIPSQPNGNDKCIVESDKLLPDCPSVVSEIASPDIIKQSQ